MWGALLGRRPDSSPYGLVGVDDIRGSGKGTAAIEVTVVEAEGVWKPVALPTILAGRAGQAATVPQAGAYQGGALPRMIAKAM